MIRREHGTIVVELPRGARQFVVATADGVRRTVEAPASAGYRRLYGRLDEGGAPDDPLVTLQRQTAIDELCRIVVASSRHRRLTDEEAEAWIKVLGLAVAMTTAEAGVHTDADLHKLDARRAEALDVLRWLQVELAFALDPSLEAPSDAPWDGP